MIKDSILISLFVFALSFALTYLISLFCIKYLKKISCNIKPELVEEHAEKKGTPNVGGIAFLLGSFITSIIVFRYNSKVNYFLFATLSFGLLGFVDDFAKIKDINGDGLSPKIKMFLQFIIALVVSIIGDFSNLINIGLPFLYKDAFFLQIIRIALISFFIMYFVNAFNIADGLDGLLGTITIPIFILVIMVILSIPNQMVTMLLGISMFGAMLCFLVFNRHPALYFMGDCGSMGLGAFLSIMALSLNIVPFFLVATLMLSIELFSSLIQIIAIRVFKKKVFEIAPIHHMYQKRGISENSIVSQFARYSTIFSIVAFFLYAIINL